MFVVFEGLDRVGKSTQCRLLYDHLKTKMDVTCTRHRFPNRATPIGTLLDHVLRGQSMDAYAKNALFAANRYEMCPILTEDIDRGWVVCDRYTASGDVFAILDGVEPSWSQTLNAHLPTPDVTIYLRADPEYLTKRPGYGEEVYERLELQRRAHAMYEEMAVLENWVVVDVTDKTSLEIHHEILGHLFSM